MSDFDRNATTAQYGRPLTRAEADVVDAGLRAYMLRVYNYMVIGLVITGFAALGAYMLSVTDNPAAAAKVLRGATEIPAQVRAGMYLTPIFEGRYHPGYLEKEGADAPAFSDADMRAISTPLDSLDGAAAGVVRTDAVSRGEPAT